MPIAIVNDSFGSCPSVIIGFRTGGAEKKSRESGALVPSQAEGPVLILGLEGLVIVTAFSNEVGEGSVGKCIELDPCLNGDGFPVGEAQGGFVGEI